MDRTFSYLTLHTLLFFGCLYQHARGEGIDGLWLNRDGTRGGTLNYRFVRSLRSCSKQIIQNTIKDFNDLLNPNGSTCIRLTEIHNLNNVPVSVSFKESSDGCTNHTDKPGMPTLKFPPMEIPVYVNDDCIDKRRVVYILARILGLQDEHTRPDRDNFLTIHEDNIKKGFASFYSKSPSDQWGDIAFPYDYTSVTHVGPFEYALDDRMPTVSSKYPGVHFGDKLNLSVIDVQKLRTIYKCPTDVEIQDVAESEYRPVHCSFDLPMCALENDWTIHGKKWMRRKGPISENGPQTDHSNGDGWYMYTNQTHPPSPASLVSRTEISPGPACVSLFYFIEDNSTTLSISRRDSLSGRSSVIREITSNGLLSWAEIRFNVTSTTM